MICCALIALLFGALLWIARTLRLLPAAETASPLSWTLEPTDPTALTETSTPPATARKFTWRHRARSFGFAAHGIKLVLRREHSAWLHLGAAALAIGLGLVLQIDLAAWRWIILCIGLVIAAEILNTAVETTCNAITTAPHPLIGRAKDMAAGAVLLCALTALILGALTFAPYLRASTAAPQWDLCSS